MILIMEARYRSTGFPKLAWLSNRPKTQKKYSDYTIGLLIFEIRCKGRALCNFKIQFLSKLALQSSNHHAALWIGSCATGVASSVTYSTGCAGPASTYQGRLLGIWQIEPEKPKVTLEGDDKKSMLRLLHHLRGILFSLGLSLYVLFSHRALSS